MKTNLKKIDTNTKKLGNSNGFAAWAVGGAGWEFGLGEQDDKASVAAISSRAGAWRQLDRHRRRVRDGPLGGSRRLCVAHLAGPAALRVGVDFNA